MEEAITNSATERVFEYGALKTVTPFAVAASRSTWFVPMQKHPIACNFSAEFNTSEVILDFERIPNKWTFFISFISCSLLSAPGICFIEI